MKNKINKTLKLFKQFGIKFSIKYLYYKVTHNDDKYFSLVYTYLLDFLNPLIEKYNKLKCTFNEQSVSSKIPVWVCWWQGYESMPDLCKMFYSRLESMLPDNAELKLITTDNYLEYAHIPSSIVKKFNDGLITYTTYSDVLRNYLIRDNGGLWIDSSVFVSNKIPKDFMSSKDWWSVNLSNKGDDIVNFGQKISKRKWSGFLQKGSKNNMLNSFVCEAFELYYSEHDTLIDYFIQNFFLRIAYDKVSKIKNIIDNVKINNTNVYSLYDNIDFAFDEKQYNLWNNDTFFYKMTQKRTYNEYTTDNKLSYYGKIKKLCEDEGTFSNK